MRMTRETYAREVWKVVEAFRNGEEFVPCPHEDCKQSLEISRTSIQTGTALVCRQHGIIFRE